MTLKEAISLIKDYYELSSMKTKIGVTLVIHSVKNIWDEFLEYRLFLKNTKVEYIPTLGNLDGSNPDHLTGVAVVLREGFKDNRFLSEMFYDSVSTSKHTPVKYKELDENSVYYWLARYDYSLRMLSWMGKFAPVLKTVYRVEAKVLFYKQYFSEGGEDYSIVLESKDQNLLDTIKKYVK